jgi:hypothetical protein
VKKIREESDRLGVAVDGGIWQQIRAIPEAR